MTIEELRELALWEILPASIRKALDLAEAEGWQLHGKGATIAFRLDRGEDELDLPAYAIWEIGKTPKGAISFRSGKGGVPHMKLSTSDLTEYLQDPTVVYPLEAEPEPEPEKPQEDAPPWDTSDPSGSLLRALGATVIEDKPRPRPLAVSVPTVAPSPKPQSSATSKPSASSAAGPKEAGTQSAAPSTRTVRPLRVTVPT